MYGNILNYMETHGNLSTRNSDEKKHIGMSMSAIPALMGCLKGCSLQTQPEKQSRQWFCSAMRP